MQIRHETNRITHIQQTQLINRIDQPLSCEIPHCSNKCIPRAYQQVNGSNTNPSNPIQNGLEVALHRGRCGKDSRIPNPNSQWTPVAQLKCLQTCLKFKHGFWRIWRMLPKHGERSKGRYSASFADRIVLNAARKS